MVKLKKKVNELLCATHSIIKYTFDVFFFWQISTFQEDSGAIVDGM